MLEKREEFVCKVTVENKEHMTTTHKGTLVVSVKSSVEIEFNNVMAIPEIICNLLSVKSLTSNGVSVGVEGNLVKICTTKAALFGRICRGIYVVELEGSKAFAVLDDFMRWHRMLGHASVKKVREQLKMDQRYLRKKFLEKFD
jgi:hypothetical protein